MDSINDILFPDNADNKPKKIGKEYNALFSTNVDWDTDTVSVDVSYFSLKVNKIFKDDNTIYAGDPLVGVGFCEKTNMINVCCFDGISQKYFWVKPEEVNAVESISEKWNINDVQRHLKAIKEKWTTQKKTKT